MKDLRSDLKDWRLEKVLELSAKGMNQASISRMLKVSEATISRDLKHIHEQAQKQIQNAIQNEIPRQWLRTRAALQSVQKECWDIISKAHISDRDKLMALHLVEEVSQAEYNIVTDSTVIDEAMRLVNSFDKDRNEQEEEEENNDNTSNRVSKEEANTTTE